MFNYIKMENVENKAIPFSGSIVVIDNSLSPKKRRNRYKNKAWKKENSFTCIVKVMCKPQCNSDNKNQCKDCKHLKYVRVRNLLKFAYFLDKCFPLWRFFNVKDNKQNGLYLRTYSKRKRPISHNI